MVRWPLQPLQPLQKTQLQPPVGPSVDSLCHPWLITTNLSYRFPIFETSATALCGTTGTLNSYISGRSVTCSRFISFCTYPSYIYIYISVLLLSLLNNYTHQWNISEIWNAPMTSHGSVFSFSSRLRRRCTVLRPVAWEEWWWRWPGAVVTDIDRKMGRPIFHHGVTCCEHGMYHLCIYIYWYIYMYTCICIDIYVYVYIYVYVCTYK